MLLEIWQRATTIKKPSRHCVNTSTAEMSMEISYETTTGKRKGKKRKSSKLARQTRLAFQPFLNELHHGFWHHAFPQEDSGPKFSVTMEMWDLYERWGRATVLRYENGYVFQPWHVTKQRLAPIDFQEMMEGRKRYFTGNR